MVKMRWSSGWMTPRVAADPLPPMETLMISFIDDLIDEVIESDPRQFGYRSTVWTAPLLRQYLAECYEIRVSLRRVSYALARLDLAWKRPRHDLIRCPSSWRQAKGG